uniref:Translocase of outer mitochondrial membrane 20 n=1 Tax=Astyanax mexicanus TaxID=7994 RepID=A0A8B9L497_ASTMX
MQTLEEPPYLTVGTDVSAKYRGAFCEAKIKTAKRLVKAKVTFKPDSSTAEVHDEHIRGTLKVGAVVEVKNQDGVYQEATINKLTDASLYTVVFDDGDEKTLRRSSLCLKGARHFAESETLDRLPLTNPEHFGTPVIGKKGNRGGRRSNPIQEEESSSSSSEEEGDQQQNEELYGKVVCVEAIAAGDKKKSWYPALVSLILPSEHHQVFFILKCPGLIVVYLFSVQEEVEPFPEERENFLQQLYKFMEDRGTPINKRPVLGYRNLNLFKLYRLVHKLGGFDNIESGSVWKQVYQDLGIPILNSAAGYNVKCAYRKYLYGFEDYCTSTGITFRMDLPLKVEKPSPPAESAVDGVGGASSSADVSALAGPSDEPKPEQEPEISHSQSNVKRVLNCLSCRDDSSQEWEEGEEFECYPPGMKVQVRYGRGRNQKTYEATVKESDLEGGEVLYLVHYCGWNIRYDEWIKADKIVRPANKNVPKIKHRKKIKVHNRLNERDDLSPAKHRISRSSKFSSSNEVCPKTEECDDKEEQQTLVKSPETASDVNGLRGNFRESGSFLNFTVMDVFIFMDFVSDCGEARLKCLCEADWIWVFIRGTDWLPSSSPKKLDERNAGPVDDPGDQSSSSSEDECGPQTNTQAVEEPRIHPKTKGSPSKKYNGLKEKTKGGRSSGFWEIPEKRAKIAVGIEERAPGCRAKGQKDVWSSIQAQWPKKTLKELFSDSDTEAANSPPPAVQALDEPRSEPDQKEEPAEEPQESQPEKSQEYPSSGSNSVLNTPPTTPESAEALPETRLSSTPPQSSALASCSPAESEDTAGPLMEECAGGRSESDSSMVEVESVGCEIQDLPREEEAAPSPSKAFDGNLSSNSNCSLTLSSSSQQDSEQKAKANSSDSEDQCISEGTAKSPTSKSSTSDLKPIVPPKCSGRTPPSHKYHKHSDSDHSQPKEPHGNGRGSRIYKWSFQMSDLEKMSSLERIAFLQEKLQDIRNHYLSLKSEVASIDRRRKRMKKKERESAAVASSSSSSSPSSSSLTAAVMLTLADPTVSGSSQNSGVSVECR